MAGSIRWPTGLVNDLNVTVKGPLDLEILTRRRAGYAADIAA